MGLAASQARLLLLTSRLSDLEYQSQTISEQRLQLATESSAIAQEYAAKTSNKILEFVWDIDGNENSTQKEYFTPSSLYTFNKGCIGTYRLVLPDGSVVITDMEDLKYAMTEEEYENIVWSVDDNGENPQVLGTKNSYTEEDVDTYLKTYKITGPDSNYEEMKANGILEEMREAAVQSTEFWQWLSAKLATDVLNGNGPTSSVTMTNGTISYTQGGETQKYVILPALKNVNYFQNALRQGDILIQKLNSKETGWDNYDLINSSYVNDRLYTEDDAAAQAEYTSKSAMIQAQDKKLELELKNIETQHNAAKTEYESVSKVIEENIQRDYKTFA